MKRLFLLAATTVLGITTVHAEVSRLSVAQEYGVSYLPLLVMEDQHLIEKEAKEAGIKNLKVTWDKFAGGNVMNDGLLSNSLDIASGGVGPFVKLWAKTRSNYDVKAIAALNIMPLYLNSDNPAVKSIKDFTAKDKIALPAVKVSIQAVTLQMAAEQAFGPGQQNKLDSLTVSMSHPDGMAALLSGKSEITAHFTSPPFQYQELADPKVHTVLNSYDVLGGPATFNLVWTTEKFRAQNPKVYAAFVKALNESIAMINKDKKWAAELYLRTSKNKSSVADILKILNDPQVVYTTTPQNVMKYVNFMYKTKSIDVMPKSWKDLFFPEVQNQSGS
ncbi:MAG TPA: ABC transporter substrate-binding protein [Rhodocyclaceae bacterium]|nr:ABC transporter substrate-binding protein [Rhodocyclaceae bacterium]